MKILKNSLFYRFSEIYSNLPDYLKAYIGKKLKKEIKDYVKYNLPSNSFINCDILSDSDSE